MRLAVAATTLVLTIFPIMTLAGRGHDTLLSRSRHVDRAATLRTQVVNNNTAGGNPPYRLREHYEGESFFE